MSTTTSTQITSSLYLVQKSPLPAPYFYILQIIVEAHSVIIMTVLTALLDPHPPPLLFVFVSFYSSNIFYKVLKELCLSH